MRIFIPTILIVLAASTAHGQGQTLQKSLMHDGIQRNYTIYVPSSYTTQNSAPLVVNIHGRTLNRSFQMMASGMNAVAEREGFLVAYPDAVNADWFGPQDNIGFVDRLLNDVSSQYSVNAAKVYATGFSQGGMMSYLLSVEMPDRFAAIASVGGVRPLSSGDVLFPPNIEATPSRPFPLLHIHGTSDAIVPYNGGSGVNGTYPSVERVVHDYVLNNGGDTAPTIVELPNTNTTDGSAVRLISYQGGNYLDNAGSARNAEVLFYRIQSGGHNWPGDFTAWPDFAGTLNRDINASNEIWNFFSRHEVAAIESTAMPGDFNQNGDVDAADYVVWRRGLGTTYTQADYDAWRANFGQTIGSGAAGYGHRDSGPGASADPLPAIPEPSTALVVFVGSLALAARCRRPHLSLRR